MPITTPEQRAVLHEAHVLVGAGSLIPAYNQTFAQVGKTESADAIAAVQRADQCKQGIVLKDG